MKVSLSTDGDFSGPEVHGNQIVFHPPSVAVGGMRSHKLHVNGLYCMQVT